MNRLKSFLFLLVVTISTAYARTPIRQWLTAMPDSVMPLLTKNNRLDFIDFKDSNMEAVVMNRLDGRSRMDTLTDDYLLINYTRSCDVAMKLLPVNDTTDVLCMVTTVKTSVSDSRVAFFDEAWQPLPSELFFVEPVLDDFRSTERSDSADVAWSKMDIFFKTYHFGAESTSLTCRLETLGYLGRDERMAVAPYIVGDTLVYVWAEGCFVRE